MDYFALMSEFQVDKMYNKFVVLIFSLSKHMFSFFPNTQNMKTSKLKTKVCFKVSLWFHFNREVKTMQFENWISIKFKWKTVEEILPQSDENLSQSIKASLKNMYYDEHSACTVSTIKWNCARYKDCKQIENKNIFKKQKLKRNTREQKCYNALNWIYLCFAWFFLHSSSLTSKQHYTST